MHFDNSYARLPPRFYTRLHPTPVAAPGLIRVNSALARHLRIDPDWLQSAEGVAVIAGNRIPAGADPIATVYAGYQFGGWSPQLGDGRAILLGEVIGADGVRYDIQLKGSGRTPYSRNGDGRAPLGPVLREYIVSEAMAALGIPSSRVLAAVTSGEWVMREGAEPGGVLVRVAQSHIRIGTFQFFASSQDLDAVRLLADHVIQRHYPEVSLADNPYLALLENVIAQQARLIASWQLVGFIHGVMNTDNMLVSGETIDYGPCAFMDAFDPAAVFSSIDHHGRYAYNNQPGIAHWNLAGLAQVLLPLLDRDPDKALALAQDSIDSFPQLYQNAYLQGMRRKLGLAESARDDAMLIQDLLDIMAEQESDFTLTFRCLSELADADRETASGLAGLFELPQAFTPWLSRWRQRLAADSGDSATRRAEMLSVNPACIARNHLVQAAIEAAVIRQDFAPFHDLVDRLAQPYDHHQRDAYYAAPPRPDQLVRQTFCGT
ncbi:MAG: YdiU family protein [Gammaproteobacteria bacterium]|nr:YdiU family protein [Gammaproteobacteria bacterium]